MRNNLLFKTIFLASGAALLIVATALATGFWQYSSASADISERTFEAARATSLYVRDQQLRRLKAASAGIAANADFITHLGQAMGGNGDEAPARDVAAIRELLDQQRRAAGLDADAVLDASGKFVAAAGDSFLAAHDLSSLAVTTKSMRELVPASAVLDDDVLVPLIAVTPLAEGGELKALLVTSARLESGTLKTIGAIAGADVAIIAIEPTGPSVIESTLEERVAEQLGAAVERQRARFAAAAPEDLDVVIDGEHVLARFWPVQASAKNAFFLALLSPDHREAIERALAPPLILAACAALLLVSLLFLFVWRRALAPLAAMASLSERARHGDFALELKPAGFVVVRRVADLVNYLLKELDRHRVPHGVPRRRSTDIH